MSDMSSYDEHANFEAALWKEADHALNGLRNPKLWRVKGLSPTGNLRIPTYHIGGSEKIQQEFLIKYVSWQKENTAIYDVDPKSSYVWLDVLEEP